jgi:hypothetical protein
MIIVLAIGPKVRGFKPCESDGFLKAIQIRSTPSFGGEVKLSAPCRKALRHVKDPLKYDRDADRQNSAAISRPVSHPFVTVCLCYNHIRELWWMNRE